MSAFTFNGIEFSTYGLSVEKPFTHPGQTNQLIDAIGLPGTNKVIFGRRESAPVTVEFNCRIAASSTSALASNLDALSKALITTTDAALVYAVLYSGRQWLARWDGQPLTLQSVNKTCVKTVIRFLAQPVMTGTSATAATHTISANPTTISVTATGTVQAQPTWTLTNTGATQIASGQIEIWNTTTGETLRYDDVLPAGYRLRINSEAHTVHWSADGVTWTDATAKAVGSSSFITLNGGVANSITVFGFTSATLAISYYGRYL